MVIDMDYKLISLLPLANILDVRINRSIMSLSMECLVGICQPHDLLEIHIIITYTNPYVGTNCSHTEYPVYVGDIL